MSDIADDMYNGNLINKRWVTICRISHVDDCLWRLKTNWGRSRLSILVEQL